MITEYQRAGYVISTDKSKLNLHLIHNFLAHSSYWAQGRPLAIVQKSIEHSLCFGVYAGAEQVGFACVVTDYATFAWLCDVFIVETHRGQGLGQWLVECVVAHPELQILKRFVLATSTSQELYQRYGGFQNLPTPGLCRTNGVRWHSAPPQRSTRRVAQAKTLPQVVEY